MPAVAIQLEKPMLSPNKPKNLFPDACSCQRRKVTIDSPTQLSRSYFYARSWHVHNRIFIYTSDWYKYPNENGCSNVPLTWRTDRQTDNIITEYFQTSTHQQSDLMQKPLKSKFITDIHQYFVSNLLIIWTK